MRKLSPHPVDEIFYFLVFFHRARLSHQCAKYRIYYRRRAMRRRFTLTPHHSSTAWLCCGQPYRAAPENQEWGTQHLPGLMESVEGFTPAFGASLFAAAAAFTRASPWESLASRRPIQLTYRLVLRVSTVPTRVYRATRVVSRS